LLVCCCFAKGAHGRAIYGGRGLEREEGEGFAYVTSKKGKM